MLFWLYDSFEKEYHELRNPSCSCKPQVFSVEGHLLIIHEKLATPDEPWTMDDVQDAIERVQQLT